MNVRLIEGDCRAVLPTLPASSIDSVVTDPPYHLTSIVKRFGSANATPAQFGTDGAYARASRGFMGKTWDGGDIAQDPETWSLVLAAMKPGAHLLAFSGTRTYHRMACAIEDAGFEIRDQIGWAYGSGFPKSHNLDGEWDGWGTALKPAWEPICVARKPLSEKTVAANVARWGVGAINVDGCRIEAPEGLSSGGTNDSSDTGWGFAARRSEPHTLGRWPANLIHDGSPEVVALFPETAPSRAGIRNNSNQGHEGWSGGTFRSGPLFSGHSDQGSAARFFYCAKASKGDRDGSNHPTVKPRALMRYLCRLVTPPGGLVLDPFAGSGSTLYAARDEGFSATGIELDPGYAAHIRARLMPEPIDLADVFG